MSKRNAPNLLEERLTRKASDIGSGKSAIYNTGVQRAQLSEKEAVSCVLEAVVRAPRWSWDPSFINAASAQLFPGTVTVHHEIFSKKLEQLWIGR